ncbi:MAG: TIGR04086 family membrane protein [Oscillospiraceae bacterium]
MRYTNNFKNSRAYVWLSSVGTGVLTTIICLMAFAFIMTGIDVSDGMVASFGSIAVCVGSYFFSFIVGKKRRKDGILVGIICGSASFLALLILNLIFLRNPFTSAFFSKLSMIIICSIIGGIIGVNSKIRM